MRCPACSETLVVVEREGIELDWCIACRGLWFDEGELELLAEKSGRRLDPDDVGDSGTRSGRRCPRCRRKMREARVGGASPVTIDRCSEHGLWLDRGELGRIMSEPRPGAREDERVILRFLGETFRASSRDTRTGSSTEEVE